MTMHETCQAIKDALDANEENEDTYALILIAKYMQAALKINGTYWPIPRLKKIQELYYMEQCMPEGLIDYRYDILSRMREDAICTDCYDTLKILFDQL